MGVEAVVLFDPANAWEFELRRKRGGHLFSKHRYLSAQMAGYLRNNLWLDLANAANARAAHLLSGMDGLPGIDIVNDVTANMIFFTAPRAVHQKLKAGGAVYNTASPVETGDEDALVRGRLVCDWSIAHSEIDRFVTLLKSA